MNLATLVEVISANYHFQVNHVSYQAGGDYRLETNHGSKRVTIMSNLPILKWSHLWREELVKQGYRQIDRYLRTQDGAFYLSCEEGYLLVQDLFHGEPIDITKPLFVQNLGRFIGQWFLACQEALQEMRAEKDLENWLQSRVESIEQGELSDFKGKIKFFNRHSSQENMFTYLVNKHWTFIAKRLRQAQLLEQASRVREKGELFPTAIYLEQWLFLKEGFIGFAAPQERGCLDFRAVAQFMQSLYTEHNLSLSELGVFYNSFRQVFRVDLESQYNLLAHLLYPVHFLEILEKYYKFSGDPEGLVHKGCVIKESTVSGDNEEETAKLECTEECIVEWLHACQVQKKLDELHLWLAADLDRSREEDRWG